MNVRKAMVLARCEELFASAEGSSLWRWIKRRRKKIVAINTILLTYTATLGVNHPAQAQNGYVWKNVSISGSKCWVTGIAVHPTSSEVYIRTDVAGLFRWDATNTKWVALSNTFTFAQNNNYSVESFALDPTNPQIVYMACGAYSGAFNDAWLRGAIFRSTNKGATWTQLTPGLDVYMGGNETRRWGGERLAVDPASPNVLLFGSRRDGLWRSTDSGAHWTKIDVVQGMPTGTDGYGVTSIAFDANTFGNTAGLVYASVEGQGVYVSRDHGATWSKTDGSGGPTDVRRLAITKWHVVWATTGSNVSRYMGGAWSTFQPNGTSGYCGLAIKPAFNANNVDQDILISDEMGFRFDDPNGTGHLYRTSDNGATWNLIVASRQTDIPWYQTSSTPSTTYQSSRAEVINVSALAYDPANPDSVWAGDWSGVSRTDNLSTGGIFKAYEKGHEEAVVTMLAAPPTGNELYSGFLDIDSFRHENGLLNEPTKQLGVPSGPKIQQTTSISYQEAFPSNLVRTGSEGFDGSNARVVISTNGGVSWSTSDNFPTGMIPFRAVIAPNNGTNTSLNQMNIVAMCKKPPTGSTATPWQYTQNGGANWYPCSGIPVSAAMGGYGVYGTGNPLVADGSWGNAFFVYDASTGSFYRSNSGGATFSAVPMTLDGVSRSLPKTGDGVRSFLLRSLAGAHGDLWLGTSLDGGSYHAGNRSTYNEGLWHSTDSGATWSRLTNIASVVQFGFGKPMPGSTNQTLFLYGRKNGDTQDYIYRSKDLGATWTNITDPNNPVGNSPMWMEGSRQTAGRVFIGTNGSGIFFGDGS